MLNRLLTVVAVAAGGALVAQQIRKSRRGGAGAASVVRETIDVHVPLRTAYDQWTQFEQFPQFMDSVHEVRQIDDKRLHWVADVFGRRIEWDAEITEQIPDKKIAWHSTTGTPNGGSVSFNSLGDTRTRITLVMDYVPQDAIEQVGDALGAVRAEARSNLKRFKEMLEQRGHETGAWRGTIGDQAGSSRRH